MALTQDIKVTFRLRKHASEAEGSIKIEDLTDYLTGTSYAEGQTVESYFVVTNPNGTAIISGTAYGDHIDSTIQADGNVVDDDFYDGAALGVGGIVSEVVNFTFISGQYTFEMYTRVNGVDTYTHTETFTVNYTRPTAQATNDLNCSTATLQLTDSTSYAVTGATVVSTRAQKAVYPAGSGQSDVTGSGATITMSNPLYTGTVLHNFDTDNTYDFEGSLSQKVLLTDVVRGGANIDVACQFNGTSAEACLQGLDSKYRSALSVSPDLAARLSERLARASVLLNLYNSARESDSAKASQYYTELKNITNCSEACSGCNSTGPQIVTPTGGGSATDITINSSATVTVTESPANTFTLTANKAAILGDIEDNRVVTADGLSGTTATVSGVKTYTVRPHADVSRYDARLVLTFGTSNGNNAVANTYQSDFGTDFDGSATYAISNTDLDENVVLTISDFFDSSATPDNHYKVDANIVGSSVNGNYARLVEAVVDTTSSTEIKIQFHDKRAGVPLTTHGLNALLNEEAASTLTIDITINR